MGSRNFFLSHARDKTNNIFLYFFNELKTYQFLISWAPGMKLYELSHQCQYLSNWSPTPPLAYIYPNLLWVNLNESDHRSYVHYLSSSENKAWKKKIEASTGFDHDLCDTGTTLYQLS